MENLKTDFFSKLSPLLIGGINLTLTIKKVGDQITVATRPQRPDVKDKNDVLSKIQPLVITETADALDSGYLETITQTVEPVNSIADGLKEFEKGVASAKSAAEKKKPAAKRAPAPKVKKEKASAKAKAPSPDKALKKKAGEIKVLEEKVVKITTMLANSNPGGAEQMITATNKLWKNKSYKPEAEDRDFGTELNLLMETCGKMKAERLRGENMEKAVGPMNRASKLYVSLNFPEFAKSLKEVYKLVADHPEAMALTKQAIEKFGQVTYDQLMR